MRTFKELTDNYKYISITFFQFKSQTDVCYYVPTLFGVHLSKSDLITCINYFLERLAKYSFYTRIKKGFVLDRFKYYELSVYLHGILQLYAANLCMEPVGDLHLTRFSHLPHDVLKAEKVKKNLEISLVNDFFGGSYYVCSISGTSISFHSLQGLKPYLYLKFPSLRDYDIDFIVK